MLNPNMYKPQVKLSVGPQLGRGKKFQISLTPAYQYLKGLLPDQIIFRNVTFSLLFGKPQHALISLLGFEKPRSQDIYWYLPQCFPNLFDHSTLFVHTFVFNGTHLGNVEAEALPVNKEKGIMDYSKLQVEATWKGMMKAMWAESGHGKT